MGLLHPSSLPSHLPSPLPSSQDTGALRPTPTAGSLNPKTEVGYTAGLYPEQAKGVGGHTRGLHPHHAEVYRWMQARLKQGGAYGGDASQVWNTRVY